MNEGAIDLEVVLRSMALSAKIADSEIVLESATPSVDEGVVMNSEMELRSMPMR